ncbi:hypothetical protein HBI56_186540 [Parastagonospora nodorum]|nr:hypothetical protein HBH53_113470 [Parastagonospora nodorum]KAH4927407.1 hypothetical protein HBI79_137150 [Parastagonospora nodorum]KAH5349068.1 hypothetical protein HBI48_177610 [Parastagonospora nodorum]KAH5710366.1 hypothetical protein HBI20_180920 [Parastagonospora nodorum]KAH6010354.1 hypothetical protein HBI82_128920 [Parastagonospora nodorum]
MRTTSFHPNNWLLTSLSPQLRDPVALGRPAAFRRLATASKQLETSSAIFASPLSAEKGTNRGSHVMRLADGRWKLRWAASLRDFLLVTNYQSYFTITSLQQSTTSTTHFLIDTNHLNRNNPNTSKMKLTSIVLFFLTSIATTSLISHHVRPNDTNALLDFHNDYTELVHMHIDDLADAALSNMEILRVVQHYALSSGTLGLKDLGLPSCLVWSEQMFGMSSSIASGVGKMDGLDDLLDIMGEAIDLEKHTGEVMNAIEKVFGF